MYSPDLESDPPLAVRTLIDTCYELTGSLDASRSQRFGMRGSLRMRIDWLHMLGNARTAIPHDVSSAWISAAVGTQVLQSSPPMGNLRALAARLGRAY